MPPDSVSPDDPQEITRDMSILQLLMILLTYGKSLLLMIQNWITTILFVPVGLFHFGRRALGLLGQHQQKVDRRIYLTVLNSGISIKVFR